MELKELEQKINTELRKVQHPDKKRSLPELGMLGRVEEDSGDYRLIIKSPDADRRIQIGLETKIRGLIKDIVPGKLKIKFEVDTSLAEAEQGNRIPGVKNVIAVGSGKGGVGKSTVTANLAAAMVLEGKSVGILDSDIYGPSMGRMFGMTGKVPLKGDGESKIFPELVHGIKLITFSFLVHPEQAVVWRGPMLGKAVEQFLYEILWGELDYLIVDLPPGTGDVQLSLAQLVDLDGAVIVTTPQNVALQDATRAVSMFQEVKVPVLGVIENMSEFICPSCGTTTHIFSKNGASAFAAKYHIPELGGIPLMQEIMETGESGTPYVLSNPDSPVAQAYRKIVTRLDEEIAKYR